MATGFERQLTPKTEVIIRSDWVWNSGAAGGGGFLETRGTILNIGDVGLTLEIAESGVIRAFPFSGITHIEIVKPAERNPGKGQRVKP